MCSRPRGAGSCSQAPVACQNSCRTSNLGYPRHSCSFVPSIYSCPVVRLARATRPQLRPRDDRLGVALVHAPDDKLEQMPHVLPVLVRARCLVVGGGQPLLPSGVMYDPFVERALEPWSFGIYAGGQSILIGLASTDLRAHARLADADDHNGGSVHRICPSGDHR
jgi:hypothetical protein